MPHVPYSSAVGRYALPLAILTSCGIVAPDRANEQGHHSASATPARVDPTAGLRYRDRHGRCPPSPESRPLLPMLRAPYLLHTTDYGTTLRWSTKDTASFDLVVRNPKDETIIRPPVDSPRARDGAPGWSYSTQISGLRPSTHYCYSLGTSSNKNSAWGSFRTAPVPGTGTTEFIVLADVGKNTTDQRAVRDAFAPLSAQFVLFAGDIAYDDGSTLEFDRNFFAVYRDYLLHTPVFAVSGNHEYRTHDALPYRQAFAPPGDLETPVESRGYSFDWGPVHFVMLDTEIDDKRVLGDAQRRWLDRDLSDNHQPHTVAVLHRPPHSSGYHGSDLGLRASFAPIFQRHRVALVIAGHDHNYERSENIDGTTYIVTGGGGRGTRPIKKGKHSRVVERAAHFLHIFATTSTLRVAAIDATRRVFDQVEFQASTAVEPLDEGLRSIESGKISSHNKG